VRRAEENRMTRYRNAQIRVGIFVFVTLVILMAAIFLLGSRTQYFQPQYTLKAVFSNVGYLLEGAGVYLASVRSGFSRISPPRRSWSF
jgi:ABC-type transporter Mla subunit MlaD